MRSAAGLPELPDARTQRFIADYGLPAHDARILAEDLAMAAYYEIAVVQAGHERAKAVANWQLGEFAASLNAAGISANESPVTPNKLAGLVTLIENGTISGKQAKEVFAAMLESGESPVDVVQRLGMQQVSDTGEIEAIVDRVIAENPGQVEAYRGGKKGLMGFFVGAVMRETGGQANPKVVNDVLGRKLG